VTRVADLDPFDDGVAETRADFLTNDFRIKRVLDSLAASAQAIHHDPIATGDIAARVDALRHLLREVGHVV
jgi:hypothetical protein